MKAAADGRAPEGPALVRAVTSLQNLVITEARDSSRRAVDSRRLDRQIEDYIEDHLADAGLSPKTIAAALGISLRHAHGVFNRDGRTIGRVIREHRLDAAAEVLRSSAAPPSLEQLALQCGFGTAATLQRHFRARFGVSIAEYRRSGHRTLG